MHQIAVEMEKKNRFLGSLVSLAIVTVTSINCQPVMKDPIQWDTKTISEAEIWKNLLVNYYYADHSFHWPERKESLLKVIEQFPKSNWADDAALMYAIDNAAFESNLDSGIVALRKVIADYPTASTIVSGWDSQSGCRINNTWLKWAPSLVTQDKDGAISKAFPFDRDRRISILEREALTYFAHLDKYPNQTKDVAQYIIALMLVAKGDITGAIVELENNRASTQALAIIKSRDYDSAKVPYGYLLECEPSQNINPIWRVQYAVCILLIELYQIENQNDKVLQLTLDLSSSCSPDGWYWNINQYVGKICFENNKISLANEQYELALEGIAKIIDVQSERMQILHEQGYMIKPADFSTWHEEAKESYVATIQELEKLIVQVRQP